MMFLARHQTVELDPEGVEALRKEIRRFARSGLSIAEWHALNPVEQEALLEARRIQDVENAILIAKAIAAGGGSYDLLAYANPASAHKLALREAVEEMSTQMKTTGFAEMTR